MCGIIGFLKTAKQNPYNLGKVMTELLMVDTLRGWHSTGVFFSHVDRVTDKNKPKIRHALHKEAVPGFAFVCTKEWDSIVKSIDSIPFMVGHNRAATKGEVNKTNAHPFKHGHITMVHNGTLTSHKELGDKHYDVDSEAICNYLSQQNRTATDIYYDVNGAYALVWQDRKKGTLNFMRNYQRPLWFAHTPDAMFWASEKEMLELVLSRNNIRVNKYEQLEPNTLVSYNLVTGVRTEEEVEYKKYSRGYSSSYYCNYYDDYPVRSGNIQSNVVPIKEPVKNYYYDQMDRRSASVPFTATTPLHLNSRVSFRIIGDFDSEVAGMRNIEGELLDEHDESLTTMIFGVCREETLLDILSKNVLAQGIVSSKEKANGVTMVTMTNIVQTIWDDPKQENKV